jgi:gamma-glutamylcyclotransferase (GGCT)/AIG2-like uncharacterized protein YtfP
MEGPQYLFVYGLLRPDSGHNVAEGLMARARHVSAARFQGRLYEIEGYPGVVESDDPSDHVLGDVFEIPGEPDFLAELDAFEGCAPSDSAPHEYRRALRTVVAGGRAYESWIYLYNWPLCGRRHIKDGDFLAEVSVELRKQVIR